MNKVNLVYTSSYSVTFRLQSNRDTVIRKWCISQMLPGNMQCQKRHHSVSNKPCKIWGSLGWFKFPGPKGLINARQLPVADHLFKSEETNQSLPSNHILYGYTIQASFTWGHKSVKLIYDGPLIKACFLHKQLKILRMMHHAMSEYVSYTKTFIPDL
jgi:hypothetical protein